MTDLDLPEHWRSEAFAEDLLTPPLPAPPSQRAEPLLTLLLATPLLGLAAAGMGWVPLP